MRTRWLLPAFGLVAAGLAHVAFSPLGFNPTDDGFVLAMSRRLLDGQVPHRDFISIRPVGSSLLHAPEVWLGGPLTYWISRLVVWLELALIAGAWVRITERMRGRAFPAAESALMITVALALSSHTFPIMAWHTIDGLALGSLGILLASAGTPRGRWAGYLLIGSATLCKQNFALLAPMSIVLLGDARRPAAWLAAAAPAAVYVAALAVTGALGDAVLQMSSQTDLLRTSVIPVLGSPWLWVGAAVGLVVVELGRAAGRLAGLGPIVAAAAVIAVAARLGTAHFDAGAMALLGAGAGVALREALMHGVSNRAARGAALAALTASTAAVSVGYASPALAAGPLAIVLLAASHAPATDAGRPAWPAQAWIKMLVLVAGVTGALWVRARLEHVYRDMPAAQLDHRLDRVLPGGSLIRTNGRTHAVLADLRQATLAAQGRPYAILTDFPGWWVRAREKNPLSMDWPQATELARVELRRRIARDIDDLHGRGIIIVQKVRAYDLAERITPIRRHEPDYVAIDYVRERFRKIGETTWFEVWE